MTGPASLAAAVVTGYLLGSVPWGVLLLALAGRPDPRTVGSGNIGATNVSRAGGRTLGALTFLLDAAKGVVAVALFSRASEVAAAAAGLAAVIGHCFPVWLRFRGGKGVATLFGVGGVLVGPWAVVTFALAWGIVVATTRFVSVGSVAASWCPLVVSLATGGNFAASTSLGLGAALVTGRHASNFRRLVAGSEPRLGARRREP